ncbi:hypothetical protein Gotur_022357 [Gossypium turneri]
MVKEILRGLPTAKNTPNGKRDFERWDHSNCMSLMIMKHNILEAFRGTESEKITQAKCLLDEIEKHFAKSNKVEITSFLNSLMSMKYKGQGNMGEYIMEMFHVASKLKALKIELFEELLVLIVLTTTYILNRIPIKAVAETPYAFWTGQKPSLKHFHIWGCPLDPRPYRTHEKQLDSKIVNNYFIDVEFGGRNKVRDIAFEKELDSNSVTTITFDDAQVLIPINEQEVNLEPQQDNVEQLHIQDEVSTFSKNNLDLICKRKCKLIAGLEGEGGGEKNGIEGIVVGIVGIEGMLGRGANVALGTLGNVGNAGMVGSGGSAPGLGKDGMDGCGRLGIDGKGGSVVVGNVGIGGSC